MKYSIFLLTMCLSICLQSQDTPSILEQSPLEIGASLTIESEILNEKRQLNIYLPAYYQQDDKKSYPVIYLLDGSMDEDFIHIAGLVQFLTFSWLDIIPESIVVGIANVDRKRDFTFPTSNKKDKADFPTTGGSSKFIDFIEKELQPFIDKQYRTNETRTIIGQSLGGLLGAEILFHRPELFDNYLIVSPSMWWDDESLLQKEPTPFTKPTSIYIAVGKEGETMERGAKSLHLKLKLHELENAKLFYQHFPELDHGDTLHKAAYDGLAQLFKKPEE